MKHISLIFILVFLSFISFGQESNKWKVGAEFNSVFQDLEEGYFIGTTNGLLIVQSANEKKLLLDFQGSKGALEVIKDEEEVYDVSSKSYSGTTSSGRTEIKYETYASANSIGIHLDDQWFQLSSIDGACDMVIDGLDYFYQSERGAEYLIIRFTKDIELNNWQYLIRTEHTVEPDNIEELQSKMRTIKILANSTVVFAIKMKN